MSRLLTWLVAGTVALGLAVLSEQAWRRKAAEKEIRAEVQASDRYVDMGVVLRVVEMDLDGGSEIIEGCPPLRVVREHRFGGVVDTKSQPQCFIGPSLAPVVWYCSVDQEPLILHGDDQRTRLLVYGSEGAGKTECLTMWHLLRVLEHTGTGKEGGATAPINPRLEMFHAALNRRVPHGWATYNKEHRVWSFVNGTAIREISTHKQSADEGERVQSYNWGWCSSDEMQDSIHADAGIESRGRSAIGGVYKRLCSCTAKDHPQWRGWKDRVLSTDFWAMSRLLGTRSPFIWPSFWEEKKQTMSPRDYQRRVLAQDVGPELQLYNTWSREKHVRPVPMVGARDVTAEVLRPWGNNFEVLVGHDPGQLQDVSVILKAYRLAGERHHTWWVVDEVTTEQSTCEVHVAELLRRLRDAWGLEKLDFKGRPLEGSGKAHIRIDPYGDNDQRPDRSVYATFRQYKLDVRSAAYRQGKGNGRVPKEAGIEMICRLLEDASGKTRLYVACDDRRQPAAPKLVEALECSERDGVGRSEQKVRGQKDWSHWPASLRYALWPLERRLQVTPEQLALEEGVS